MTEQGNDILNHFAWQMEQWFTDLLAGDGQVTQEWLDNMTSHVSELEKRAVQGYYYQHEPETFVLTMPGSYRVESGSAVKVSLPVNEEFRARVKKVRQLLEKIRHERLGADEDETA